MSCIAFIKVRFINPNEGQVAHSCRRGTTPMNVLIIADLHLDLWTDAGRDPLSGILPVLRDLDALIVTGDLADDQQRNWSRALARLGHLVAPERIWVIPGNHGYYGAMLDDDVLARITMGPGRTLPRSGF